MSSKLTFAKSVHSWVCLLHVFLFRPQVPEQHVNLVTQALVHTAFEEDAAWRMALREGRQRREC